MNKPFAVFDIDGTIIRWQLYHAISDQLVKTGLIDSEAFEQVRRSRMDWKRRAGADSFKDYENQLVKIFDRSLAGMDVKVFNAAVDTVFELYKDQVYTYTRDLILDLKKKGYLLFAVSGSPSIIVKKLADYYGFDDFAASNYPEANGRFTGQKDVAIGRKPQLLQSLMQKHHTDRQGSIGVGDSEGDIDILALVEKPIAFNPSQQLFAYARDHQWDIVLERKNVVYKLRQKDGNYGLIA